MSGSLGVSTILCSVISDGSEMSAFRESRKAEWNAAHDRPSVMAWCPKNASVNFKVSGEEARSLSLTATLTRHTTSSSTLSTLVLSPSSSHPSREVSGSRSNILTI